MTKNEFLTILRDDLDGMVSRQVINENIAYYGDYFDEQLGLGRSEAEIAAELGNPSLTARTIIDANEIGGEDYSEVVYTENDSGSYYDDAEDSSFSRGSFAYSDMEGNVKEIEIKWYHKLIFVLAVILIIALLVLLFGAFVTFVLPVLIVLALVYYIWSRFFQG